MKIIGLYLFASLILLFTVQVFPQDVNFTVIINDSPTPISPYIYGANPEFTEEESLGARRQGGNRLTGYNWENNASSAGTDWNNSSDNYLTWITGISNDDEAGIVTTTFHNYNLTYDIYSLITLQMAGYASKDKNGEVLESETAPSSRWDKVQFVKGSDFSLTPSLTDTSVFMDEYVNFLVNEFGQANTAGGIKGYALDNEPALWPSTHPRIHSDKPTCSEVVQRSIALSNAVKNVDEYAEIFGPALYGFNAFTTFQDASDWASVRSGKGYNWFIDYYLDEMRKAETTYGKRLLDVLDVHWYPEAYGDSRITETGANTANDNAARLQAPRSLWDPAYGYSATNPAVGENSWIANYYSSFLPLIPKLQASINKYYPGTKLAITEFTYGGENDITGSIATSDVLGIFGKYGVYLATFWPGNSNTSYVQSVYRIFRNYDGQKSTFGDASTPAYTSDSIGTSIYSSIKTNANEIHLMAINKNLSSSRTANFAIQYDKSVLSGNIWVLDNSGTEINNAGSIASIQDNSFSYTMPAGSVSHIVLQTSPFVSVDRTDLNSPAAFRLDAYPNPFNLSCKIEYSLPDNSHTYNMVIIDIMGRVIKTYRQLSKNGYIVWNGTNENNQAAASGVYCVLLKGNSHRPLSKRIVLLK